MARKSPTQIVTANDLLGGAVVYFTGGGRWSDKPADALTTADESAGAALLEQAAHHSGDVVGPYLVDVTLDARGVPEPVHIRERIRVTGPTVARQHRAAANP